MYVCKSFLKKLVENGVKRRIIHFEICTQFGDDACPFWRAQLRRRSFSWHSTLFRPSSLFYTQCSCSMGRNGLAQHCGLWVSELGHDVRQSGPRALALNWEKILFLKKGKKSLRRKKTNKANLKSIARKCSCTFYDSHNRLSRWICIRKAN